MLAYEANDLTELGRAPDAVRLLEPSKPFWEKLPDHFGRWGVFAISLSHAYIAVGRCKEAEDLISAVSKRVENFSAPWNHGYFEYLWAAALAGQHSYQEALAHAENATKDWSAIPKSITISPEGYRRISNLNHLLAEIRSHLGAPQNPGKASNPITN